MVRGSSSRKILKTKKAEEAISGHFAGAILPSENEEFQRTMLPFIVRSFWIKDLDRYMHIYVLDIGCIRLDLLIFLYSDFSISGHYSDVNKPNWCNPLIFNSPVFCSASSLMFGSFAGSIPRFGTFFHYSCHLLVKG